MIATQTRFRFEVKRDGARIAYVRCDEQGNNRTWCAGKGDTSPVHSIYNEGDCRCSHCWHGFPHTQALHRKNIGEGVTR